MLSLNFSSSKSLVFALLFSMLVGAGCSKGHDYGETGTVAGKLTLSGKPLSTGNQVVFMHPEAGYAAFGETDAEGNFKITSWNNGNLPVGTYSVMIQPPAGELNPDTATAEELLAGVKPESKGPGFPFKYRQISTSNLKYEVKVGENTIDINLEP